MKIIIWINVSLIIIISALIILTPSDKQLVNSKSLNTYNIFKSTYPNNIIFAKIDTLKVSTLWGGDVFWGRYVNDWAMQSQLKEAYPFSGLNTFNWSNYDYHIGSLNCPITDLKVPSETQNKLLMFNCTPNYMSEVKKYFEIFNLANSHTDNQNEYNGFEKTKSTLDQNGIQYFGHYDKDKLDDLCEVVSLKTRAYDDKENYLVDEKNIFIPIAICGYHDTFSLPTSNQLKVITKYSKYFPTIVYAIQGAEYQTIADGLQREYFRKMIDAGADMVIGKGAHVVQNTESYKGKLIVYSMGNFIYDQQRNADVTQGILINVNISVKDDDKLNKYKNILGSCISSSDDCISQAEKLSLQKYMVKYSFSYLASDNSNKLAKAASKEVYDRLGKVMNWSQSIGQLKY